MQSENIALTTGCHHIGLTVNKLEESANFFTKTLGWQEVRRDKDYPAIFVTDHTVLITLWGSQKPEQPFDKNHNIGLHHLALKLETEEQLTTLYHKLLKTNDIKIEFAPELLRQGPAKHMMCYEPSGIRIEFIWPGNN